MCDALCSSAYPTVVKLVDTNLFMEKENHRELALIQELETSVLLIKYGLRELQTVNGGKHFYHVPMLTLANGFERLMKVIICLSLSENQGCYPNEYPWDKNKKVNGHDLEFLLSYITESCFSSGTPNADVDFLNNNERLKKFVRLLSNFGMSSRYYNLDVYKGRKTETESPQNEWQKLEKQIVQETPGLEQKLLRSNIDDFEALRIINREIVIMFERLARALSRLFTLGNPSNTARSLSPILADFIKLMNDDLGQINYK